MKKLAFSFFGLIIIIFAVIIINVKKNKEVFPDYNYNYNENQFEISTIAYDNLVIMLKSCDGMKDLIVEYGVDDKIIYEEYYKIIKYCDSQSKRELLKNE